MLSLPTTWQVDQTDRLSVPSLEASSVVTIFDRLKLTASISGCYLNSHPFLLILLTITRDGEAIMMMIAAAATTFSKTKCTNFNSV